MSETYEEIIKEIEDLGTVYDYSGKYDCLNVSSDTSHFSDVAMHLCERVREAVASDPKEWRVNDANDNHVHLGDVVDVGHGDAYEVLGFRRNAMHTISLQTIDGQVYSPYDVCKVIPDTREKIIEDAMARFEHCIIPAITREVVEQAVDRAMKLGALK